MDTMIVLWMMAGFAVGWVTIEVTGVIIKSKIPFLHRIVCGLIGTLIAFEIYTRIL